MAKEEILVMGEKMKLIVTETRQTAMKIHPGRGGRDEQEDQNGDLRAPRRGAVTRIEDVKDH